MRDNSLHARMQTQKALSDIEIEDRGFQRDHFLADAKRFFFEVQNAWQQRDLSPVSELLTSYLFENLNNSVQAAIKARRRNVLEGLTLDSAEIVSAVRTTASNVITIELRGTAADYVISEATEDILAGNRRPQSFVEEWTFEHLQGGAWRLAQIVFLEGAPPTVG